MCVQSSRITKGWFFLAELSLYETQRKPHEVFTDNTVIGVSPRALHSELMCPICLDLMKTTLTTKEVSMASPISSSYVDIVTKSCLSRPCACCIVSAPFLSRLYNHRPTKRVRTLYRSQLYRSCKFILSPRSFPKATKNALPVARSWYPSDHCVRTRTSTRSSPRFEALFRALFFP